MVSLAEVCHFKLTILTNTLVVLQRTVSENFPTEIVWNEIMIGWKIISLGEQWIQDSAKAAILSCKKT